MEKAHLLPGDAQQLAGELVEEAECELAFESLAADLEKGVALA